MPIMSGAKAVAAVISSSPPIIYIGSTFTVVTIISSPWSTALVPKLLLLSFPLVRIFFIFTVSIGQFLAHILVLRSILLTINSYSLLVN